MKRMMSLFTAVTIAGLALADSEGLDARFSGGSFDGWDRCILAKASGLGGVLVTLSSDEDQIFDFNATFPVLATLTLVAEAPGDLIAEGVVMRLCIPADWVCRFKSSSTVIVGGASAAKVGAPRYADEDRTLELPVLQDFEDGDEITIAGLRLAGLRLVAPGTRSLELDFNGDGQRDIYDFNSLTVLAMWPGGDFDGWDTCRMTERSDMVRRDGTRLIVR